MQDKSDAELLQDYAGRGQKTAFREIVTRHADLVFSAALRQVNSPDLASDITQEVFMDLARKARKVAGRLTADATLAGWLFRSTRYAALNHLRDDRLRVEHERQAMEQLLTDTSPAPDWERVRPFLDEALTSLSDGDRDALLLRYFENRDFRAVGLALGVSDDTAQKRVSRAVERLRELFARRGIAMGAGGLAAVLSANAVQSAPTGLAAAISTAASAGAVAAKAVALTTLQKVLVTTLLAAAVGTGIYEAHEARQWHNQAVTLKQQQADLTAQAERLTHERDDAVRQLASLGGENQRLNTNSAELLRLRSEVGQLRSQLGDARKMQESARRAATIPEIGPAVEINASVNGAANYKVNFDLLFAILDVPAPAPGAAMPDSTFKVIRNYLNDHGAKLDPADSIIIQRRLQILAIKTTTADTNAIRNALLPCLLPDRKLPVRK